jgi:hypothetical protein
MSSRYVDSESRDRPSYAELRLAVEALVALVDEEYPARPLRDLAKGLSDYRPHPTLTDQHYAALAKVERSLFSEALPRGRD